MDTEKKYTMKKEKKNRVCMKNGQKEGEIERDKGKLKAFGRDGICVNFKI